MEPKTVGRVDGETRAMRYVQLTNGLVAGSKIFTQDGEMPVEFIGAGDRVITRDAGLVEVKAVRSRRIMARAIRFTAGSLGHTRPESDTVLIATQEVLIRDWRAETLYGAPQAMIPAERLIDGEFVEDLGERMTMVFEIEFETPHVIYADGLEVASAMSAPVKLAA